MLVYTEFMCTSRKMPSNVYHFISRFKKHQIMINQYFLDSMTPENQRFTAVLHDI